MVITRLTRNQLAGENRPVGSNPTVSANLSVGEKMKTSMKDLIKMIALISILLIVIIVVIMIVIQYQIEGEKDMPYKLSKITIISTAEGEQNTENIEETAKWNLSVNQNNDVYFFIDKKSAKDDEFIENVTIENINITKQPLKGNIKMYMPSSVEGRTFLYDDSYIIDGKLEYKGGKTSNPKILEIGSQGGSAILRFSNTQIGKFISNENIEVKHDGTLISKVGINEDEVKFQVNFDLIIQINGIKYKSNIYLDLPCNNLCTEGTTTKEITDMSNIVFKRVK